MPELTSPTLSLGLPDLRSPREGGLSQADFDILQRYSPGTSRRVSLNRLILMAGLLLLAFAAALVLIG